MYHSLSLLRLVGGTHELSADSIQINELTINFIMFSNKIISDHMTLQDLLLGPSLRMALMMSLVSLVPLHSVHGSVWSDTTLVSNPKTLYAILDYLAERGTGFEANQI